LERTCIVGYWPLDVDYQDYSGNDHHGTATGSPAATTGVWGTSTARTFSSGKYVSVTNMSQPTSTMSIAAWVNTNVLNVTQSVVAYSPGGNGAGNGVRLYLDTPSGTNKAVFDNNISSKGISFGETFGGGAWVLLVGTINRSEEHTSELQSP
jgi:hypothetical protein